MLDAARTAPTIDWIVKLATRLDCADVLATRMIWVLIVEVTEVNATRLDESAPALPDKVALIVASAASVLSKLTCVASEAVRLG